MIDKILEYQAADGELQKIEDDIQNSPERKRAKQAQTYLKEAEENLQKMDKTAAELFAAFQKISAGFSAEQEQMEDYGENIEAAEDLNELSYLNKKVSKSGDSFGTLEREMSAVVNKIAELNKTFREIMEKVPKVKKIYVESRQKLEALKKDKEGEIKKLQDRLVALEKQNDPKLLAAYKRLRSENTTPAVVQLYDKARCGGCRMEMPMTAVGKIETEKYIICDSCGRIVYKA